MPVEHRVYVECVGGEPESLRRADVAIVAVHAEPASGLLSQQTASMTAECELPMPIERQETFLVIRDRETMRVMTVMELLSPANKRTKGDGRHVYMMKRQEILSSPTQLVELDLLRGGMRLRVVGTLPAGDFYAIISRARRRPKCEVFRRVHPGGITIELLPNTAPKKGTSSGLVPMGSQLAGSWALNGRSIAASTGASPKEAGRQPATIADFSGLQRGRIHRKCPRKS